MSARDQQKPRPVRKDKKGVPSRRPRQGGATNHVFGALPDSVRKGLELYPDLLRTVLPLSAKHRNMLPDGVKRLSAALTSERAGMDAGYLRSAGARAAYLHFFLPWNLYRLGRLLPGLDLKLAPGASIADIGCGPLTFVQALWLTRPDLRDQELEIWCLDREKKMITLGMDLFRALAKATGHGDDALKWRIRMVNAPLEKGVFSLPESLSLLAGVNVLNEVRFDRRDVLADQVEEVVERWAGRVDRAGQLLFIEPGTRLGGKLVSLARAGAMECGFTPLGPCTHANECPMLDQRATSWCHFSADTRTAPEWLGLLSRRASMGKERASLSFALLRGGEAEGPEPASGDAPFSGRVVSDSFRVPGEDGSYRFGRYVCTEHGLVLVYGEPVGCRPEDLVGARVVLRWPETPERDAKTNLNVAQWMEPPRAERRFRGGERNLKDQVDTQNDAKPRRRYAPGSRRRKKKNKPEGGGK